jgi:DNA anti-recombination protein RmuC
MPQTLMQRLRDSGLPLEPPAENPAAVASASWEQLHAYAAKVLEMAHQTDDDNKRLIAQNESCMRENARLVEELARVNRELRATVAYAESIRTRLTSIAEQINAAASQSLQHANQSLKAYEDDKKKGDDPLTAALALVAPDIRPANGSMPAVSWANKPQ